MHTIAKYIVFIIILIAFVMLFIPRYSFKEKFASELGEIMADINKENKVYSTILYLNSKNSTEEDYLDIYNTTHPISSFNEPLIMNRCIQFVNDKTTNRGGIDLIIQQLYNDKKIFVSDKISFDYTNYNDIEIQLQKYLYKLYYETNTNAGQRVEQFYGPGYVLITQYPYVRTINTRTCEVYPTTLQGTPDRYLYSPKPIEDIKDCQTEVETIQNKKLRIEIYVLLPAHTPVEKSGDFKKIVGPHTYKTWAQIRCNMRRLFAYNPSKRVGVSVVNPRSFDEKCTVECVTPTSNQYKYICGARNHTMQNNTPAPYESIVLGTKTTRLLPEESLKHDYANLYLINSEKMNLLLRMNTQKGMFRDCIEIQPIPANFNTSYNGCDFTSRRVKPTGPQTKLSVVENSVFNIRINNKCLSVDNNKLLKIHDCNVPGFHDTWAIERRTIPTERDPIYLIYTSINKRKWFLTKDSINSKAVLTSTKPKSIGFKPDSVKQIRLVELIDNDRRINWNTEKNFCLTLYENNLMFMSTCSSDNTNIDYIPLPDATVGCNDKISLTEFEINLKHVADNLA